jgi:methylated-DNA-[protein]-cysteine S-methyltransferase
MIAYINVLTPLGTMRLAATRSAVCGAWFQDQPNLPTADEQWREAPSHLLLKQAHAELDQWFAGQRTVFDVPLEPRGTPFQSAVWRALLDLPFGTTVSYGELARFIDRPTAVRAVGAAVGRNPISIFIPCHRVVGRDTALTGFGGGLVRKRALLVHEGHQYVHADARARRVLLRQAGLPS